MTAEEPPSSRPSVSSRPRAEAPPAELEITLQNPGRYPEAGDPALVPWLERLVANLAPRAASLTVRFTSDREMRRLNRTWRGKDRPTDVLSFPGEETPEGLHLGDVVLAVPVLRRQAEELGHPVRREIRTLLLHGVLHCLGHDHETDDGAMDALEERLRGEWIDPDDTEDMDDIETAEEEGP